MTADSPPFAYYGGKTSSAQRIIATFPAHQHYVEPFAGSLAVLLAKGPAIIETVNDLDEDLMTFWRVIRDQPDELIRVCASTPHSRAEHQLSRTRGPDLTDLERARRVWVTLSQTRAASLRAKSGWRHFQDPAGTTASMTDYLAAYVARMEACAQRLAHVSLECRPADQVIADYGKHPDALLYVDPPYLRSSRNSYGYVHEMSSEDQHRELADQLHACRAAVVLSGYDSPLYTKLYDDWHAIRFVGRSQAATPRTEVLWSNRPAPTHLFT